MGRAVSQLPCMTKKSPFRHTKTSLEIIRLAVMLYDRFRLSFRYVEALVHERGIDVSHETVRFWRNSFGPMFATEIRNRWVQTVWVIRFSCRGRQTRQTFSKRLGLTMHLSKLAVLGCERAAAFCIFPVLRRRDIIGVGEGFVKRGKR